MSEAINQISDIIWSDALIILCLGLGVYFTIRFKFPQIRYLKQMIQLIFAKNDDNTGKGISSFQAFSLAISGRVGTGNIAGVATAIGMGGPGALFWMWAIAFLGSASAMIEAALAQLYKEEDGLEYRGGPAFYIKYGLKSKYLAILFALVAVVSTGFLLPGVQSNSISLSTQQAFGTSSEGIGIVIIILLAIIIIGGVKRIGKVAEMVVPFMAGCYILLALIIIGMNIGDLPDIFALIFRSAWDLEASLGGMLGMAISWGVKRAIYSNEAGQGTAPHAAAAASVSHPMKQGLLQGFSVYVDTLFICTATGLMILFTGMYNVEGPNGDLIIANIPQVDHGPTYTQLAIDAHFPGFGSGFVAVALAFFAFTTIMAYYYIAESNIYYLFRGAKNEKIATWGLRVIILVSVYTGCISSAKDAWLLGDIGVGMMAWINLIAILLLHRKALILMEDYDTQKKQGLNPIYTNEDGKIAEKTIWEN